MRSGFDPILTVAQMRAAEQALVEGGDAVETLMERAGTGAADWIWRVAAGRPVTVLCGPGNNGGDGYVIARELTRRGAVTTVVAPMEPTTEAAIAAREAWGGTADAGGHGGVLVDCLFGSGLTRPLSRELTSLLNLEAARHHLRVAVDLPSGIDSDRAVALSDGLPAYDLTLALGAWKFAHWLMPAMPAMGERRLVPIGIGGPAAAATLLHRPLLAAPARDAHKYTRGLVLVVAGRMPGAAQLACDGALRAGAGAVRLSGASPSALQPDVVHKDEPLADLLADDRTGAVLVGPGLGRDGAARGKLAEILASGQAAVVDADALALLYPAEVANRTAPLVLTPHEGEMHRLADTFGIEGESKVARATALARSARAVVVAKGPDTVIAAPDGRTILAPSPTSWLAVAGTGDVLAGAIASRLATHGDPLAAACEGVWLHGEAARRAGPAMLASELALNMSAAYVSVL